MSLPFKVEMHTDIGIRKETNQDSMCVKEAQTDKGNILFTVICDGMGGLEKGEVASATIINAFSTWFENELPYQLSKSNAYDIIHFLRREMLNFTAFPVFFVSNLLLVQRKKYYFNRATVSRNCSIVL